MFLYCRKVVSILIGFYTSRLLLERLGDADFGLYGLIGSIIVLFSSLRSIFSTSIQRYINVAKASGRPEDVQKIFSIGTMIQLMIAVIFFVAVEIGGFFLIPELNIAPESMADAWWVFHLSLLAAVVLILTVPYDALIISNEKFNVFAALSIVESVLRLGIVALLIVWPDNRVVWYSLLTLLVSLLIRAANMIYCRRAFGLEAKFRICRDRQLFRDMTVFAGWNFLGSTGFSVANNGTNFILNIFGGVGLNTARAIAVQVQANITQFVTDMSTSFQPRSIMAYTRKEFDEFYSLMFWNSKVNFFISGALCVTLICAAQPVISLWLGEVPAWTVVFTQFVLVYAMVRSLHDPVDTLFRASGQMKWYQITEFSFMILNLPVSWIALKLGAPYYSVFIILACIESLNFCAILCIARVRLGFALGCYARRILVPVAVTAILLAGVWILSRILVSPGMGIWATLGTVPVILLVVAGIECFSLFNAAERSRLAALFHLDKLLKR